MTSFDELIGAEPAGADRERLRKVHELLVEAGPPPEITPAVAAGPTTKMTLGRLPRMRSRRMFIPAIAAAMLVALIIGFSTTKSHDTGRVISLEGTPAAPHAAGSLAVYRPKTMRLAVHGLKPGRYGVYIVSNGRPSLECGSFVVANADNDTTATLTSPYEFHAHEWWVVTRENAAGGPGVTVLRPTAPKA